MGISGVSMGKVSKEKTFGEDVVIEAPPYPPINDMSYPQGRTAEYREKIHLFLVQLLLVC